MARSGMYFGAALAFGLAGFSLPTQAAVPYVIGGWTQGAPPTQLIGESEGVCVLTRVSGSFKGGGEQVRVYTENGFWKLGGSSGQDGVGGTAHCVRWNAFTYLGGGDVRWISGEMWQFQKTSAGISLCWTIPNDYYNEANAWWGDAGTYVAGMQGSFNGGGEMVQVRQSSDPSTPSTFVGSTIGCGNYVKGFVRSIFIGKPSSGHLAKFHGPGTIWPVTMPQAFEYEVSSAKGPAQQALPSADQALCYFTQIRGKFRGGGEFVSLGIGANRNWQLTAQHKSAGAPDGVFAKARCYAFLQQW